MTHSSSITASPWPNRFRPSAEASIREAFADRWLEARRALGPGHPVSAQFTRELHSAVCERDAELRGENLLILARALENDPSTAQAIYRSLEDGDTPLGSFSEALRTRARDARLSGLEPALRGFVRQSTDPVFLASLTVGSGVASLTRFGIASRLSLAPATWLTTGSRLRLLASAGAILPEAVAISATDRLLRASGVGGDRGNAWPREVGSLSLQLGLLRSSAWLGNRFGGAWGLQAGNLFGLRLAQELRGEAPASRHPWSDAFASLLQFNVASRLTGGTRRLDARTEWLLQSRDAGAPFPIQFPTLELAGGRVLAGLGIAASSRFELPAISHMVMSEKLDASVGERSLSRPEARGVDSARPSEITPELWESLSPLVRGLRASLGDAELAKILEHAPLNAELLARYANFNPHSYGRSAVLREGSGARSFEILVLSWENGQASPPHDHAGSSGFERIVSGGATEISYQLDADGRLEKIGTQPFEQGAVSLIHADDIHAVGNYQANGGRTLSLHVYRPIMDLSRMRKFLPPEGE